MLEKNKPEFTNVERPVGINVSLDAMKKSSDLLLRFVEQNPKIVFCYSAADHHFIYTNAAFRETFQEGGETPSLKKLFDMVNIEDRRFLKGIYVRLKPGLFKNDIEFRMEAADHRERCYKLTLLKNMPTKLDQVITGSMEDISAFRAHEDKLNELSDKKNAILNILSHDLAGPLGSIKNFTQLISRKISGYPDHQLPKMLVSIEEISKRCIQMIQDFIKLEFIQSAGVDMVKIRQNLVTTLTSFMQEYIASQENIKKKIAFKVDNPEIFVEIDGSKFIQVINNLLSNAIKFTHDGGNITVSLEEREETVLITVADDGIGIPEQYHATLFDKFNNARRPGLRGEPSVGLGMSIVKTIVEWHKGKIWFHSEENRGTTFYLQLSRSR